MGEASALGLTVISSVIAIVGAALGLHYRRLLTLAHEQSRKAEAANRVKDQFLANLSHELRTPVHAVLGWARLLATGKLDHEHTLNAVAGIERASWAQARLIEDLLDLSCIVSGKLRINPVATMIQPLIEAAVDSLRPAAAAKHITLTVRLDQKVASSPPIRIAYGRSFGIWSRTPSSSRRAEAMSRFVCRRPATRS